MAMTSVILVAALGGFVPPAEVVSHFPGSFFHARVREPLERQVKASWPGPGELMRLWRDGELTERQRVALLVGGAAYHDPIMLPAYREAIESNSQLLRQAAIYGYRECIADTIPNVDVTIGDEIVNMYREEMGWMARTVRRRSLIEIWLQSALIQEGASLPGYWGVRLTRTRSECMRSAARLADVGDLGVLVTAFELSSLRETRVSILKIIEGLSVSRFIVMPKGERTGWGSEVFESAMRSLTTSIDGWQAADCSIDDAAVLRQNLASLGVEIDDPFAPEACWLWVVVIRNDVPQWWPMAARRLYACGGPWIEISSLDLESEQRRRRRQLVDWYKPQQPSAGGGS